MKVSGPFAEYKCSGCGAIVSHQLNKNHCDRDLDRLRSREFLYCAACPVTNSDIGYTAPDVGYTAPETTAGARGYYSEPTTG